MKIRYSESLILIWQLAETEARKLRAPEIEPRHLLLSLCKSVDLDLPELVRKDLPDRNDVLEELLREVRRLRVVFRTVGLDARAFRHALRSESSGGEYDLPSSDSLHRSILSKQMFADAEHLAEIVNSPVFPMQLLYAILATADGLRDRLIDQFGISVDRLRKTVTREVAFPWAGERPKAGSN